MEDYLSCQICTKEIPEQAVLLCEKCNKEIGREYEQLQEEFNREYYEGIPEINDEDLIPSKIKKRH